MDCTSQTQISTTDIVKESAIATKQVLYIVTFEKKCFAHLNTRGDVKVNLHSLLKPQEEISLLHMEPMAIPKLTSTL